MTASLLTFKRVARCLSHLAGSASILVIALMPTACGGNGADTSTSDNQTAVSSVDSGVPSSSGSGSTYSVVDVDRGGTIRGTVRFIDEPPASRTLAITEDTATCGSSRLIQDIELGHVGGLANAVISLADIQRGMGFEPADATAVLDQRGCDFTPHVLLTPSGSSVRVLNNDPLTHNVHTQSFENRSVNRTQPPDLREIELAMPFADRVKVQCDLHPWMSAWVIVIDHPYYAITDETGVFTLSEVPTGTYAIEVWHEATGAQRQTVTVVANQTAEVNFEVMRQD